MSHPTVGEVLDLVASEVERDRSPGASLVEIEDARRLLKRYRAEPIGGRLLWLKRPFFWLLASSFDRHAKVIEATLDALDALARRR